MELTDKQWIRLEPVILQSACKKDSRGRKCRDPREVLNGILWVLRTVAPWKDLPDRYPSRTRPAAGDSSNGRKLVLSAIWLRIFAGARRDRHPGGIYRRQLCSG